MLPWRCKMSATLSRARSRYTFESQSRQRRSTDQLKTHLVAALGVRPTALSFRRGATVPVVSFAVGSATAAIAVSKPTAPLRLSLGLVALLHLNEEADHRGVVQVVFLFHCFLSGETPDEKKNERSSVGPSFRTKHVGVVFFLRTADARARVVVEPERETER